MDRKLNITIPEATMQLIEETMPQENLEQLINKALNFFDEIINRNDWICCYPYGAYNENVKNIIKAKGACVALSTTVGNFNVDDCCPFEIPRLDTNDFPPKSNNFRNLKLNTEI